MQYLMKFAVKCRNSQLSGSAVQSAM